MAVSYTHLDVYKRQVVWRGPVIGGTVKQFWSEVVWGDVDYMFVDMPPGTGDVPLTVFQSLPIDGIIIVCLLYTSSLAVAGIFPEKAEAVPLRQQWRQGLCLSRTVGSREEVVPTLLEHGRRRPKFHPQKRRRAGVPTTPAPEKA